MAASTKNIVIDASTILAILLPDEKINPIVQNKLLLYENNKLNFIAPNLLKYEISNALQSGVLQKRLTKNIANKLYKEFLNLNIKFFDIDHLKTLRFAFKHKITIYDASYIYLSKNQKVPLLTLDKKLQKLL